MEKRNDKNFFIGDMIPTCSTRRGNGGGSRRKTLTHYAQLPNYRNYWKEAGYGEEMAGVEKAIANGNDPGDSKCLSERWLADNTLYGPLSKVLEGLRLGTMPALRRRSWCRPPRKAINSRRLKSCSSSVRG